MSQKGETIEELNKDGKLVTCGDVLQQQYQNKDVWFTLDSLRKTVANEMKVNPELLGPNRKNNDFYDKTVEEIRKLQKNGHVSVWSESDWKLAFRLTHPENHQMVDIKTPTYIKMPPSYNELPVVRFGEEEDMKRVFAAIITQGDKDNTYKFALAKTILDFCRYKSSYNIPYKYLAAKFFEHYWYQEYKFKMKQDFKKESSPKVIKVIRNVFGENPPADFKLLDKNDILTAKGEILKEVFGHDRRKTSLVVPRFQNIPGDDGDTLEYGIFYNHNDDKQMICLRPEAFDFFKRNHAILTKAVIAEWAKFLEKINDSLPYLVSKIEVPNRKREPLTKYSKMYRSHTDCCFYCGTCLEKGSIDVDHFIPWSYIFSNEPWNLVLTCKPCNQKKSDYLPDEEFKASLINRNKRYYSTIKELKKSLNNLDMGRGWEREIDNHYETCVAYGFGKRQLGDPSRWKYTPN